MPHVPIRRKAYDSIANACNPLYVRFSIPSYTTHLFIEAILALHVFSMYNRNKSMTLFLSSLVIFECLIISQWLATTNSRGSSTPPSSLGGEVYGPGSGDFVLPHCANLIYPESYVFFFSASDFH
jgi:hypothetical protein